jgi:uncharacterized iron-regulated protein
MNNTFTIQQAIEIQTEQLLRWKKVLKDEVYQELEKWAKEGNDKILIPTSIRRGSDLTNFIENYHNIIAN